MATTIHDFVRIPKQKYTAIFADGSTITATDEEFKNRLDFYNWIIRSGLAKKNGLQAIYCKPIIY